MVCLMYWQLIIGLTMHYTADALKYRLDGNRKESLESEQKAKNVVKYLPEFLRLY